MIHGKWYPQDCAASYAATLLVTHDHYTIEIANNASHHGTLNELQAGSRLGNIERKITLKDGSLFTTSDNDAIDAIFKSHLKTHGLIHTLESRYRWVFISVAIVIFIAFALFKWGVPWTSKQIAHALPSKTNTLIATNTLEFLDKFMFEKSDLNSSTKEKIDNHFHATVAPLSEKNNEIGYTLHFRKWDYGNMSIPNALALPSGDIILTDQFVKLCKTQEEMDAVLLHEMGHVAHKHSLEMAIESTFISVAVMLIVGDSSGLADVGAGIGSLLVSSAYSRNHESQADEYAFDHMLKANMNPASFSHIMERITKHMEQYRTSTKAQESNTSVSDYLSSHPNTQERIAIATQYAECFAKGLRECPIKRAE